MKTSQAPNKEGKPIANDSNSGSFGGKKSIDGSTGKKKNIVFDVFFNTVTKNIKNIIPLKNANEMEIPTSGKENAGLSIQRRNAVQLEKDGYRTFCETIEPFIKADNVREVNRCIREYKEAQRDLPKIANMLDLNRAQKCQNSLANTAINSSSNNYNLRNLNIILLSSIKDKDVYPIEINDINKDIIKQKKLLVEAIKQELDTVVSFFLKKVIYTLEELDEADQVANIVESDKKSADYRLWIAEYKNSLPKNEVDTRVTRATEDMQNIIESLTKTAEQLKPKPTSSDKISESEELKKPEDTTI